MTKDFVPMLLRGSMPGVEAIRIRGARQHNLRNVDVDIPRGKLVVVGQKGFGNGIRRVK